MNMRWVKHREIEHVVEIFISKDKDCLWEHTHVISEIVKNCVWYNTAKKMMGEAMESCVVATEPGEEEEGDEVSDCEN